AAEDAAAQVDLVHGGVALTGRDAVLGRVLGGHDADAVGRAGGRAKRTADALLEPGVFEPVQLVPSAEPRVDRRLLLRVLDRGRTLDDPPERRLQPSQRLAERAVGARRSARPGMADHLDHVGAGVVGHETTTIAVTSALSVARGSRIFHPNDISWS